MIALIVFLFCVAVALGTGFLAAQSDFKGLTIPNCYPAVIAGLAVPALAASYLGGAHVMGPPLMHVIVAAAVLAITFILFTLKVFGGGDSKLLAAFGLWAGGNGIVTMLFYMALFGALLGAAALFIMKKKPFTAPKEDGWIARVQAGENKVPYGIPIVLGAVIAFIQMGFFSASGLGAFVQ